MSAPNLLLPLPDLSPACPYIPLPQVYTFPGGEGTLGTLQFKSLMHSALTEHLLYAWPCAGHIETSKENMVPSLKTVQNRLIWGSKNREPQEFRGGVPSSAQGGQEGPLGGRLLS